MADETRTPTDLLTTRDAAEQAGLSVRQWHAIVAKHELSPAMKLPGVRGAMLWTTADVDRVADLTAGDDAA